MNPFKPIVAATAVCLALAGSAAFGQPYYQSQPPAYPDQPAAYGSQPPGYGDQQPTYGNPPPGYQSPGPDYGNPPSGYQGQPSAYGNEPSTTVGAVTVYAPRTVGRSAIGAPIQVVSEQVVVPAADLDLTSDWGMHALRDRVRHAAHDVCQDLADRYPDSDDDDCYGRAVRGAFEQVAYQIGYAP